jgi:hypothetical protein
MNNIHSVIDVITNSSTEIFTTVTDEVKTLVCTIVDMALSANGSTDKCDDLFEISVSADFDDLVSHFGISIITDYAEIREAMENKGLPKRWDEDLPFREPAFAERQYATQEWLKNLTKDVKQELMQVIGKNSGLCDRVPNGVILKNKKTGETVDLTSLVYESISSEEQEC